MNTAPALALIALATITLLAYIRRSKHQVLRKIGLVHARQEEILARVSLQEPRFSSPLPWTGWSIGAECLLRVIEGLQEFESPTVVEVGAGVSTLHLAAYLKVNGGRLITIENSEEWGRRISRRLEVEGLAEVVTLHVAPLVAIDVLGVGCKWFQGITPESLETPNGIHALLIDGPPSGTSVLARLPALPILKSALIHNAAIFLDDADRHDESQILEIWRRELGVSYQLLGKARRFARIELPTEEQEPRATVT